MTDRRTSLPDDTDPSETQSVTTGYRPATAADKASGRSWGDLTLLNEIGRGGFGQVYRAWDESLAREVALKIVTPRDGVHRADLLREGQMLARVKHPNVVTVFRAQQVGEDVGITMELIKGHHLSDVVAHGGAMGAEESAVIGVHLCQAVAAVHAAGLIHRDIKTRNVMRETGGRIVLMDFGAGRDAVALTPGRHVSDFMGTPLYFAPELLAGERASPASDLYSVGVLLFYLVTRRYPVEGTTVTDLVVNHRNGRRNLLTDLRPDLPTDFVRVVDRALASKPAHRYQTAGALVRELSDLGRVHPSGTVPAPEPPAPVWALRKWVVPVALGLVGSIIVTGLLGFLTTEHYDRALNRVGMTRGEGVGTWFRYGLKLSVLPAAVAAGIYLTARLVAAIWYFLRRGVPRLGKASDQLSGSISSWLTPEAQLTAQGLFLLEVAVIGLWAWAFWPLLETLPINVNAASPLSIAVLDEHDSNVRLHLYGIATASVLALGSVSWWWLLTKSAGRNNVPGNTAFGGILALIGLVLLLAIPDRLFYKSMGQQGTYNGQTCFDIGGNGNESLLLLYCPDSVAGQRIKTVASSEFQKAEQKPSDETDLGMEESQRIFRRIR